MNWTMLMSVIYSIICLSLVKSEIFLQTTRICSKGETCESRDTCEWATNKYKQIRSTKSISLKKSIVNQLKAAVCNKDEKGFCCPRSQEEDTSGTYLPTPDKCGGLDGEDAAQIIGGENTRPGEFPFMALIGYWGKCKKKKCHDCKTKIVRCIKYLCGGTLINRRYVLTAAHCHKPSEKLGKIRQVILGDWDLNINPDCKKGYSSSVEQLNGKCLTESTMPKSQKFKIESSDVKIHPDFRSSKNGVVNDIALVRLPRLAQLNEGTGLTCLPIGKEASTNLGIPNLGSGLLSTSPTVVGWGYTEYNPFGGDFQDGFGKGNGNVASHIQKKLKHSLLPNNNCHKYDLLDSQICGAGSKGHGSCKGDSGSGLFLNGSLFGPPYYQIGIVSYGYLYCDSGKPTIYTRIFSFLPWIKQNLKP